jgi:hypothetical protein
MYLKRIYQRIFRALRTKDDTPSSQNDTIEPIPMGVWSLARKQEVITAIQQEILLYDVFYMKTTCCLSVKDLIV